MIEPDPISSGETFGPVSVVSVISPSSIASAEAFGSPAVRYSYVGTGGIFIGSIGDLVPEVSLNFPLTTSWNINASIDIKKTASWNVGELPLFWFRVMGDCRALKCPGTPVQMPQRCGSYYITMVLAATPREVCEKLARSNFLWRIVEMHRLSTPANNLLADQMSFDGQIDLTCNKLIPVPHCELPECLPFCVNAEGFDEWGMAAYAQDNFLRYEASGGITLSGAGTATNPSSVPGTGGITLGGEAVTQCSNFNYVSDSDIDIIVSGTAVVISTQYNIVGTGGITLSGSAVTKSSSFGPIGSGGITLGGSATAAVRLSFASSGHSSTPPSFAGVALSGDAEVVAQYFFETAGSGGITLGGSGIGASSYFAVEGEGEVILGGHAPTVSPDHHATGDGGVVFGGEASCMPIATSVGGGGASLAGAAEAIVRLSHTGSGSIVLGGEAGTNRFFGTGGIALGGAAVINSTWKGLYVDEWGMDSVCENLEPVFGVVAAPSLKVSTTTISQCGCTGIPSKLQISHNMGDSAVLSAFLVRNGLTLPAVVDLVYKRIHGGWLGNVHLYGRADESTYERWDITFEWSCTTQVFGASNVPLWKLGFYVRRFNDQRADDYESRMAVLFDPEPLCTSFNQDGVNLEVNYDTFRKRVTVGSANATIETSVLHDNANLFGAAIWRRQTLDLVLKPVGSFSKIPRYDIGIAFPKPGELTLA